MSERRIRLAQALASVMLVLAGAGCAPTGDEGALADAGSAEGSERHEGSGGDDTTVVLSEAAFATAGIEVVEVQEASPAVDPRMEVPAQVEYDPSRVAFISARASGLVERLHVVEGEHVQAAQLVAELLSSAFLTAQSDYLQALRRAGLLSGTRDQEGADALATAARRRLQFLGADAQLLGELASSGEPKDLLPITAPFAGTIIQAHTRAGAAVEVGTPLFTLADLSVVHVAAEVPERSLAALRTGQRVTIRLAAYPETALPGRIDRIRETVDATTRTTKALIHASNPQGLLRPGMFATVTLHVPLAAAALSTVTPSVTVPASALLADGDEQYVFIETGPRTYQRRVVTLTAAGIAGVSQPGIVLVQSGLAPGERVVSRGAFTLKSERGKHAFGGDDH